MYKIYEQQVCLTHLTCLYVYLTLLSVTKSNIVAQLAYEYVSNHEVYGSNFPTLIVQKRHY